MCPGGLSEKGKRNSREQGLGTNPQVTGDLLLLGTMRGRQDAERHSKLTSCGKLAKMLDKHTIEAT